METKRSIEASKRSPMCTDIRQSDWESYSVKFFAVKIINVLTGKG